MLSYRHAFHAGNHADVLKHLVLLEVLHYTMQKEKPFWYIDTHAGAGMYALDKGYAVQNAEFKEGVFKLWETKGLPDLVQAYVDIIRQLNPDGKLRWYPGSPQFAQAIMRPNDRLRLFELHPNDFKLLNQSFKHLGLKPDHRRVITEMQDGFTGIKALLPPPPRRAVVLIDPPYEDKQDYQRVVEMIKDSLSRFATGTYLVWHPVLQRAEPAQMISKLMRLNLKNWVHIVLKVQTPSPDGFGMFGSGLFIINPPWNLPERLQEVMPCLRDTLALDAGAEFSVEAHIE